MPMSFLFYASLSMAIIGDSTKWRRERKILGCAATLEGEDGDNLT